MPDGSPMPPARAIPSATAPLPSVTPAQPPVSSSAPTTSPRNTAVEHPSLETVPPGAASVLPVTRGNLGKSPSIILTDPARNHTFFNAKLLQNFDSVTLQRILEGIPVNPQSPTLRDLARQFLITEHPTANPAQKAQMISLRARKLWVLGFVDDARNLLNAVPDLKSDPSIRATSFEVSLLAKDAKTACADLNATPLSKSDLHDDGFLALRKDEIFCLALTGHEDEAVLALDLLRERNGTDPTFLALIEMMLGGAPISIGDAPSLLQFMAFQTLNKRLPPEILSTVNAGLLTMILSQVTVPMATRIDAAERALSLGAIGDTVLAGLYGADNNAMDSAGPRGRAMLYRQARDQSQPQLRAEALAALWSQAKTENHLTPVMLVAAPLIGDLTPAPETLWFAPASARSLYLAGRLEAARAWYSQTRDAAERFGDVWREALIELWPLAYLADGDGDVTYDQVLLDAWIDRQQRVSRTARIERISALIQTLKEEQDHSLGGMADAPTRAPLSLVANTPTTPSTSDISVTDSLQQLEQAVATDRKVEALTLCLTIAGDRELARITPAELTSIVRALIKIGLPYEARRFALDVALAVGA